MTFSLPFKSESMVNFVSIRHCLSSDRVYMKPSWNGFNFTYVYKFFFKDLNITFSLPLFKCQMLTAMNVAPSELHSNNWAFLKAFQISCHRLHIKSTINIFMYFYQLKHGAWLDFFK